MMNELIPPIPHSSALPLHTIDGEPRAYDLDIAERLGFARPSDIRKLIKRYEEKLNRFNHIATVAEWVELGDGARREVQAYYLDEKQSAFICMKSETLKAFEVQVEIVEVFVAYRNGQLQAAPSQAPEFPIPKTLPEALRLAADQYERAEAEKAARLAAEARIEADRPKVEFHDEIAVSDTELHIRDVVKLLVGYRPGAEKRLVDWMQAQGWLEKGAGRVASRWACAQGLLRRRTECVNGRTVQVTVVTGKGLTTFRHLFRSGELWTGNIDPARCLPAPTGAPPA